MIKTREIEYTSFTSPSEGSGARVRLASVRGTVAAGRDAVTAAIHRSARFTNKCAVITGREGGVQGRKPDWRSESLRQPSLPHPWRRRALSAASCAAIGGLTARRTADTADT